jgi:hypothetical protein
VLVILKFLLVFWVIPVLIHLKCFLGFTEVCWVEMHRATAMVQCMLQVHIFCL